MKSKLKDVILLSYLHPKFLAIVEQLAADSLSRGNKPVVLDFTGNFLGGRSVYNQWILKISGHRFPKKSLGEYFKSKNFDYIKFDYCDLQFHSILEDQKVIDSLNSALVTYYRKSDPAVSSKAAHKYQEKLRLELNSFAFQFEDFLIENRANISTIFIPNGRFPDQRVATILSEKHGLINLFYEIGLQKNSYYLEPFVPQSRVQPQIQASVFTENIDQAALDLTTNTWLQIRSGSSESLNLYNSDQILKFSWSAKSKFQKVDLFPSKKIAVFFTSSNDELAHLTEDYAGHKWESQFKAIEFTIDYLLKNEFLTYLRIHPNLVNKSRKTVVTEKKFYKKLQKKYPNLRIIWHNQLINSYEILSITDICFVWNSTIGMEASAMGIPVWACAQTNYGLIADIKEVFDSSAMLSINGNFEWKVNTTGAKKYIYYLSRRDKNLITSPSSYVTWDLDNQPLLVKIAGILNSFPKFSMQVFAIIDRHINAGLREKIFRFSNRLIS